MRYPAMYLERHGDVERIGIKIRGLNPEDAAEAFLNRFYALWPEERAV
jgi:hypothetical protein